MWATLGTRLWTGRGPDCAVVRVVDGDTVILHCHGGRFERAELLGYRAPQFFNAQCVAELRQGLHARWHLQVGLWNAEARRIQRHGRTPRGRAVATLFLDGADARRRMVSAGLGLPVERGAVYDRRHWCRKAAANAEMRNVRPQLRPRLQPG